ncbi:hypothetical protein AGMMS50256_36020 [Betaproteobacteria bacterium]|nr:hypothetical protein AGMMS50256_36020 [Betaproteobacteria bacterium]
MTSLKTLSALAIVSALAMSGVASAATGEVTFQNLNTSTAATYSTVGTMEAATYANAQPKPDTSVPHGASDSYTVINPASTLSNPIHVRYKIGSKQCVFHSSFSGTPNASGQIIPNWTKTYDASGGAICTVTITYTAPFSSFDWKVTFTMK